MMWLRTIASSTNEVHRTIRLRGSLANQRGSPG